MAKAVRLSGDALRELLALARFGVVGVASTLVYLICSYALLTTGIVHPAAANIVSLLVGILSSYLGHYYFTYRLTGRHVFFGPRFLGVTAVVFCACIGLERVLNGVFLVEPKVSAVAVAVVYPVASLLLNHFWTFLRGRPSPNIAPEGEK